MGDLTSVTFNKDNNVYQYTFFNQWMYNTSTYKWTATYRNGMLSTASGKLWNWTFHKTNDSLNQGVYGSYSSGFVTSTTDTQKILPLLDIENGNTKYTLPALKTSYLLTSAQGADVNINWTIRYDYIQCKINNVVDQNKYMFISNGSNNLFAYSQVYLNYTLNNYPLKINGALRQGNLYSTPTMEIEYQYSYDSNGTVRAAPRWRGFNTIGGHSNNNTGKIVDVDIYKYTGTEGGADWYGYYFDNNRSSQRILMSNSIIYSSCVNENTYYVQSDEHYHSVLLNFDKTSSTYFTFLNTYITNMTSYNSTLIKFYNLTPTLTEHSQCLWNPWVGMGNTGGSSAGMGLLCSNSSRLHDNTDVRAPYSKIRLKKWAINVNADWPILIDYDHMPPGSEGVYGYQTTGWVSSEEEVVYSDTEIRLKIHPQAPLTTFHTGYTDRGTNTILFTTQDGIYGVYRRYSGEHSQGRNEYTLITQVWVGFHTFEIEKTTTAPYGTLSGINTPYAEFNAKFRDNWSDRVIYWAKGQNTIVNGGSSLSFAEHFNQFCEGTYYITFIFTVEFLDSNNNVLNSRDTTFVQTYTQRINSDGNLKPWNTSQFDIFA